MDRESKLERGNVTRETLSLVFLNFDKNLHGDRVDSQTEHIK